MGKGDKKTKKGKISSGSFGVSRPHKKKVDREPVSKEKGKDKGKEKEESKPKASAKAGAKKEAKK